MREQGFPVRLRFQRGALPLVISAALAGMMSAQPAMARYQRIHHRRPVEETQDRSQRAPDGPLYAVVSLADQHVSFYDGNGLWARSPVSTGINGHPTPTGLFTVLEKERWHRSNIYSGAPMPFMQRITWTGIAMHSGVVPGHPASHGCIRMPDDFAKRLFGITKVGMRVLISPHETLPTENVNPHLPEPKLQPGPGNEAEKKDKAQAAASPSVPAAAPAYSLASNPIRQTSAAPKEAATSQNEPPPASELLNPAELAKAMKAGAAAKAADAARAEKAANVQVASKMSEARTAAKELEAAQAALRGVQAELEAASAKADKAQGDEAAQKAAAYKTAVEAKLAEAKNKADDAQNAKNAKDQELASAQSALQNAEAAGKAASAAIKEAARRLEPVSIFISRKTQRIYVRQAFQPLFDMPVTIRDPERPIGTHLFIATRAARDGASLNWVALTPPAAVEVKVKLHSSRRSQKQETVEDVPSIPFPESASGALDRIEIPQEAMQRLSELVWTGATVILSDVGTSGEGRFAMDFMILAHTKVNVPAG